MAGPESGAGGGGQARVVRAIQADLLDFAAEPAWGELQPDGLRWRPDHFVAIDDRGRIAAVEPPGWKPPPGITLHDQRGRLLLPGFVDTHVHSAQLEVIASYGSALLDWLERYTFPSELAYADEAFATVSAERFCDALLAHGTTCAAVFPTVHKVAAEALFAAAQQRGMRIIAGKVLMDRHAPEGLTDDVAQAERDVADLVDRWHGNGRCSYAVTVRFAPTSTPEQLGMAGALLRGDPSLYFQTHLAENRDEVRWVGELFPKARSYLDVYAGAGLLHRRSVFAHGIWLDDHDHARLAEAGAQVAFCPSSNLFLGSGLLDWARLRDAGVAVSVASDVGGGTSLAMPRTLADGYKVQALAGGRLTAWSALYAATRGAARALELDHELGWLEPGRAADLTLWDWSRGTVDGRRQAVAHELHERVFAWLQLADERHLVATWVGGEQRFTRGTLL